MSKNTTPLRIPETMGAAEIGPYLRSVREHFGFSPQDVSERLHIRVRYIHAMEESKFELMPGKVYARGYIHTYSEFLGLDADQVVDQAFAAAPTASVSASAATPVATAVNTAAPKPVAYTSRPTVAAAPISSSPSSAKGIWRNLWLPALCLIVGLMLYTQFTNEEEEPQPAVAEEKPVTQPQPEALLSPQYEVVMPTAQNYDCFTGDLYLTCFYDDRLIDEMGRLDRSADSPLAPKWAAPARPKIDLRDTSDMVRDD